MTYEAIATEHDLPSLAQAKEAFDFEEDTLRCLRKAMGDRLNEFITFLDSLLQPDNTPALYESSFVHDEWRAKVNTTFHMLMRYARWHTEVAISRKQEDEIAFVKATWEVWEEIIEAMLAITRHLKTCWDKEVHQKSDLGYLG